MEVEGVKGLEASRRQVGVSAKISERRLYEREKGRKELRNESKKLY
jgi:hypothetical protein